MLLERCHYTEQRYPQIEKEALGIMWACEKFSEYIPGMTFHIETDRKESGTIREKLETPRSYIVETPTGSVRRNRRHLIEVPVNNNHGKQESIEPTVETERSENNTGYYTRSGRLSVPPQRLEIRY